MWFRKRSRRRRADDLPETDPLLSIEVDPMPTPEPASPDPQDETETLDLAQAFDTRPLAPPPPRSVEETGLGRRFLLGLVMKVMYTTNAETATGLSGGLALAPEVIEEVLDDAKTRRLVSTLGSGGSLHDELRYELTDLGAEWAREALVASRYAGAAPVPISQYREQIARQRIATERVQPDALRTALEHLVLPESFPDQIGPALNSGKAIMLYGGSGNGKTSVAEAVIDAFESSVYLPHAIEADGQIITFFEPGAHQQIEEDREVDPRWVLCRRPAVIAGGELSMEMLDLTYDPVSNVYEAPSHIKATGGIFVIDDFGRQRASATDILNRWILPLDRSVDFLTLRNGKKLQMPFDQIIMFSTNARPESILDSAALRRVPYKIEMSAPTEPDFVAILERLCAQHSMSPPGEEVLEAVFSGVRREENLELSSYQPRFLIEYTESRAAYIGCDPQITAEIARDAIHHLAGSRPEA